MNDPDHTPPLDYSGKRKPTAAEQYERNGWIGLAITLGVCAIVAFAYFSLTP